MHVAATTPAQTISPSATPQQPGSDETDAFSRALQAARRAAPGQDRDRPDINGRSVQAAPQKSGHHMIRKASAPGGSPGEDALSAPDTAADPVVADRPVDRPDRVTADVALADLNQAADQQLSPAQPQAWLPPGLRPELGRAATPAEPVDQAPEDDSDVALVAGADDRPRPGRGGGASWAAASGADGDHAGVARGKLDELAESDTTGAAEAPLSAPGAGFGQAFRQAVADAAPAVSGATAMHPATGAPAATPDVADAPEGVALPEREIRAPLHSPAFPPALGAQLTLLVKEGVTEARLHLNPAEMGPIAVQIQIEGHHARVEMVAEHASTRQALEQSMPSLASALRDSGLTLTGGGVFEHSTRQDQQSDTPANARASWRADGEGQGDPDGGAELLTRLPASPRGVVDVYA